MSILIKGMEMPTVGTGKVIMIDSDGDVWAAGKDECTIIAGAKAVPVPPHGDLKDADALIKSITSDEIEENSGAKLLLAVFTEVVKSQPTIIEAEVERK